MPKREFTFVDLFCGIGGFRIGIQRVGGRCVFSSEIDKYARETYADWFGEEPSGDIRDIDANMVPNHDLLTAGFPCQPFSVAGISKNNSLGRRTGFDDEARGNLFDEIVRIVRTKRPKVVLLENVKNLVTHDKGKTFRHVCSSLEALGYAVCHQVIDAAGWVPQHRERVFIVAFRKTVFGDSPQMVFPESSKKYQLTQILQWIAPVDEKYTLSDKLWSYLQEYKKKHRDKGNGFGYEIASLFGVTRTLSARYGKDGSEILVPAGHSKNPRRLTPFECARLMGFPDKYGNSQIVSDTQAYRQYGNAVVVPLVTAIVRQIMKVRGW